MRRSTGLRRGVAGALGALLIAAGGVLVVATPAHAATAITSAEELNDAIALANGGNEVEVELGGDILLDRDLDYLLDGTLTIHGEGFAVRRTGVFRMFEISDTAAFIAHDLVFDAAGGGPSIAATGTEDDAAASPTIKLTDVELFGTLTELTPAIDVYNVALTIDGASIIRDSQIGLYAYSSFETMGLSGLRVVDVDLLGVYVSLGGSAALEASGLDISESGDGFVVAVGAGTSAMIDESTFSDNWQGVQISNTGGTAELRASRITGSATEQLDLIAAGGMTLVENLTIDGGLGGGATPPVFISQNGGDVTIAHATITENEATDLPVVLANDIGVGGTVSIEHTIIGANTLHGTATDLVFAPDWTTPSPQQLTWSLIGTIAPTDAAYDLATDPAFHNYFDAATPLDPGLEGPAQHGGLTANYLPATDSLVVNAGDPAFSGPPAMDQRGYDRVSGGIIDLGSVEAQFAGEPFGLDATPGSGHVVLTWPEPDRGDAPIDDYVVEYREISAPSWSTVLPGPGTTRSTTITGLTNGDEYQFRVAAETGYGAGPFSPVVTTTPEANPAVSLDAGSAAIGQHVQLSGTGFEPDTTYTIVLNSDPIVLGTAASGPTGVLSFGFTVPSAAPVGAHTVTVMLSGSVVASVALNVTGLPPTGVETGATAALGAALLLVGLLLAAAARRRRSA